MVDRAIILETDGDLRVTFDASYWLDGYLLHTHNIHSSNLMPV